MAAATSAHAAISFSGTAMQSTFPTNYIANTNYVGVLLNLDSGTDWSALNSVAPGTAFTIGSQLTINATTFTVFGRNNATSLRSMPGNASNFSFTGGMSANDQFAILIFPTLAEANSVSAGTGLSLWRSSNWLLPANDTSGSTFNFATNGTYTTVLNSTIPSPSNFPQNGVPSTSLTGGTTFQVVPEPSTYALLALSGLALGGYAMRRRRRA
ncbi:MAG: PEP-CTERM sorting domain-containing protein [Chthoniobacterales bacterium]